MINWKRYGLLSTLAAGLAAVAYFSFVSPRSSFFGATQQVQSDKPIGLPEFVEPKAAVTSTSAAMSIRGEFLKSTDLKELYERLIASDEPGAKFYAVQARGECTLLGLHFGTGSDAWTKFHAMVGEGDADRAGRRKRPHA